MHQEVAVCGMGETSRVQISRRMYICARRGDEGSGVQLGRGGPDTGETLTRGPAALLIVTLRLTEQNLTLLHYLALIVGLGVLELPP